MLMDRETFKEKVAEWIREERKALCISQQEMAAYLNKTRSTIAMLETGKQQILAYDFYRLWDLFQNKESRLYQRFFDRNKDNVDK